MRQRDIHHIIMKLIIFLVLNPLIVIVQYAHSEQAIEDFKILTYLVHDLFLHLYYHELYHHQHQQCYM